MKGVHAQTGKPVVAQFRTTCCRCRRTIHPGERLVFETFMAPVIGRRSNKNPPRPERRVHLACPPTSLSAALEEARARHKWRQWKHAH